MKLKYAIAHFHKQMSIGTFSNNAYNVRMLESNTHHHTHTPISHLRTPPSRHTTCVSTFPHSAQLQIANKILPTRTVAYIYRLDHEPLYHVFSLSPFARTLNNFVTKGVALSPQHARACGAANKPFAPGTHLLCKHITRTAAE